MWEEDYRAIGIFQMHGIGKFAPDGRADVAGQTIKELQCFDKFGSAATVPGAALAPPKVVTISKPKPVISTPASTIPMATSNTDPRK